MSPPPEQSTLPATGPPEAPPEAPPEQAAEPFAFGELTGEVAACHRPADLEGEVRRLVDPAAAVESLHWGRNYLYRSDLATPGGALPVVVKQFRGDSLKEKLRKRSRRGSRAARSWRVARAMRAAGLPTPEPLLRVEVERSGGPSFFICRHLPGVMEARYLLRAAADGEAAEKFPEVDLGAFLEELGRLLRRLHDAGFWHRDVSVGNVLLRPRPAGGAPELWLVDLNRTRRRRRLSLSQRSRDMCRLSIFRRPHQEALLAAYWGGEPGALRRGLFLLYHHAFQLKYRLKGPLRRLREAVKGLAPRRAHAHIPPPPAGASARDKVVWDPLSDQPHQHAGRLEKTAVRLADTRAHLEGSAALLAAVPRIWRRYRRLTAGLYRQPVAFDGLGVCLRPWPDDPEGLLAAVDELGVRRLLLRLHPWQSEHDAEEELARELAKRGYELAFSLPQNRELVRDPGRWQAAVAELAERFTPFGRHFQVGQAINRSKWGIWRYEEYVELTRAAAELLRRQRQDVEILGPAVIDFEHHVVASVLNLKRPGFVFDAVASLLYVDRRGAPENRQVGFDSVDKVVLLRAIAETARNSGERCWITEVNWPLKEGPHAPAGRKVAVDEEAQADYLVRYDLLTLGTGLVERVYWWQLIARGYGLVEPLPGGALRRRPAWAALAALAAQLEGSLFAGPLPAPAPARLYRFRLADGDEVVAGWNPGGPVAVELPRPAVAVTGRDGQPLPAPPGTRVEVDGAPRYFRLQPE